MQRPGSTSSSAKPRLTAGRRTQRFCGLFEKGGVSLWFLPKKAGLRAGRPGAVRKGVRGWLTALPFILPGLILVAVFVLYPLLFTIRIALSNYQIVQGNITFIGLENFKRFCPAAPGSGMPIGTTSFTRS